MKNLLKKIIGTGNIKNIQSYFLSKREKELKLKRKSFYSQFLKKGGLYFDVGANYGNRIEPIIDLDVKIIAVEPQVECAKFLMRKYKGKITVIQKGLGEKEEKKTMYISDAHTLSSFSKEWIESTRESGRFSKFNWEIKREIELTTLDNLIELYGLPDFVKIDVEGYELEVLRGLSHPVNFISFEYTVPERFNSVIECIDRLSIIYNNELELNYSTSESMEWALAKWIDKDNMIAHLNESKFLNSTFGDIYVRKAIT